MNSILLQKQIKDNANDLQDFCKDLKSWGEEMKRKDEVLKTNPSEKKTVPKKQKTNQDKKVIKKIKPGRKIGGTDYAKWDKFDVDAECEKLDDDIEEDSELTDECDESQKDEALVEKEKGNKFVKNQKWDEAIKCYTKAIDCYSYDPIFYANRALCYLRKGDMTKAESDCNLSIKLDDTYVKAYQRRAAAREALNKLSEAKQDLLKVLKFEPNNLETRAALDILKTKMGEYVKSPDLSVQRPVSKFTAARKNINVNESEKLTESLATKRLFDTSKAKSNWGESENIIPVKAIKKPPHLRSKKPLKRIKIVEKDIINTSTNALEPAVEAFKKDVIERKEISERVENEDRPVSDFKQIHKSNKSEDTFSHALPRPNENNNVIYSDDFKIIERNNVQSGEFVSKNDKDMTNINLSNNQKNNDNKASDIALVPPKTSVQFKLTWSHLKTTLQKYQYIKLIEPRDLPRIFEESLESDDISSILEVLVKHHIENKEPVYDILQHLTEVKRFIILSMFMTDSDKNYIKKLVSHASESEHKTKEEVDNLLKNYGVEI